MGKKIKLESVFYYPNPVFDFLKKFLHKQLPTKKNHAQPKGEKKSHATEHCPPPPP